MLKTPAGSSTDHLPEKDVTAQFLALHIVLDGSSASLVINARMTRAKKWNEPKYCFALPGSRLYVRVTLVLPSTTRDSYLGYVVVSW